MIVIAGVDDSPVSGQVIEKAIEQARWRDAELHVVHVMHIPLVYTEVAIDWAEVAEAQRTAVWDRLEPSLATADVPVVRVDLDGYPPDTLVDYAREQGASLLVVGTRGRGDLASLILGSTSHRAIHLSDCDILVVKAETEDEG
ncbi:MAG: universal stress protein [Acidimicrobiia bacterium]|jgi:nucleotide-binding universal stress UspA family protein